MLALYWLCLISHHGESWREGRAVWIPAHALSLPGFALVPVWGSASGAELAYILLIFICILKVCKLLTLYFNRLS